jgi:hypothetical protein
VSEAPTVAFESFLGHLNWNAISKRCLQKLTRKKKFTCFFWQFFGGGFFVELPGRSSLRLSKKQSRREHLDMSLPLARNTEGVLMNTVTGLPATAAEVANLRNLLGGEGFGVRAARKGGELADEVKANISSHWVMTFLIFAGVWITVGFSIRNWQLVNNANKRLNSM